MLQLSCTQKPASHDRQNGSKRCHGKEDFGMKVAMIGHKDFPSRSGGVEVMVGGLATSLVKRGYEVTVYNRGLQKGHMFTRPRACRPAASLPFRRRR